MSLLTDLTEEAIEETTTAGAITDSLTDILLRFLFNFVVIGVIVHFFYYPKSHRRDYYFSFMLINVCVFFLVLLMGGVKLKVGFALGIFAIFGILRYRTESVPIREMTYLFLIIALSVINALSEKLEAPELIITNLIFIGVTWLMEGLRWVKHTSMKLIMYDKIQLITPEHEKEMLNDLKQRTGLDITKVEVGHIDFLKDAAMLKVYYADKAKSVNSVDALVKLPKIEN